MKFGEQLVIGYEDLWDIQDPLEQQIIGVPGAAEYYGTAAWDRLREVATIAINGSPNSDLDKYAVSNAVVLEIDELKDAGRTAENLVNALRKRGTI